MKFFFLLLTNIFLQAFDNNSGQQYFKEKKYKQAYEIFLEQVNKTKSASSQNNLASMYKNGYFVKQNYKKAFDLYYKAAQMNHPNAQNNLALMYINGFGVAQSYNEAFLWFSKAAKNNDAESLYNLSILYKYGMGVDKNETLAQHNKQKAFEAGYNKDK